MRPLNFPIVNERGERLVAVHENSPAVPVQVSLVLARHQLGIALVYNAQRNIWELPGGFIDVGEDASAGALRELQEESGLSGSQATLLGILEIERPAGQLFCALYECRAQGVPRACGVEVSQVEFWHSTSTLEPISAIDAALLGCFEGET